MDTATYGDLTSLVHQRYGGRRVPLEVSIEVTRRCPLECQHCYNNLSMSDHSARLQEMDLEEHRKLLDELLDAGCLWILYTGGEIFARKDFLEIYTEAKRRGFLVTLFTNGTLINDRIADYLADWRPFAIEITLYGATRETYESLTQIPGSYDRCMRGIRLLLDRNLPLKLKTVPTTINWHEVSQMKRLAEGEFGVQFKFDPLINPRIDCSQSPLTVRLSPEQAVALDFSDAQRKEDYRKLTERDLGTAVEADHSRKQKYSCGGGVHGCAVDPYGTMSICVISHQQGYDIRKGSFQEGWEGPLRTIREQRRTRPTICDRCQIQSLCSMCPATGELENGDPESPVEFLCQVAHLRALTLGCQVPEHGDCPCCEGGIRHVELVAASKRLQRQEPHPGGLSESRLPLPILNVLQAAPQGGCVSCGMGHG